MKKKVLATVLSLAVVLGNLAGCSSNQESPSTQSGNSSAADTEQTSGPAEQISLEVWVRDSYYDLLSKAAAQYMEKTPNVKIEVVQPENVSDQLALALSSGETPDIVSMDCVLVPYFSSIGALADMTDKVNSLPYKEAFSGGLMDLAKYQDKTYAVPFAPDVSVLLYNKDHFKEAGLNPDQPPKSWSELTSYAQKLTTNDHYGYVYGAADAGTMMFTFVPYIWSNGGDVLTEDGQQSTLNQPKAVEALQYISDLESKYKVVPQGITSYGWTEAEDAFKTQSASMIVLGSAAVYSMVSNSEVDFGVGTALIPAADGKNFSSFSGGDSLTVMKDCKNQDAAWNFIQYLLSEDVQVEELAKNGSLPARSDLFDNEYFNNHPEYEVMKEALMVGKAPYSLHYNEMYAPFLDGVQAAINNTMPAKEALDNATANINSVLSQ